VSATFRFRVLGPLAVERDGTELRLGGVKQRSVLAILLLSAGEVVSTERLIDALWCEAPPDDAPTALHAHISRLRRSGVPIVTRAPGYVVAVEDGHLDLQRFEALRAAASAAEPAEAARLLRDALAEWTGEPLADLAHEPFAVAATDALRSARLDALESRLEADLALGRPVVPELTRLVAEHPLEERLRGLHMLALYRAGRQAEALESYTDARRRLIDELGLEPGPDLRALQKQILEQDRSLGGPRGPVRRLARRRGRWVAAGGIVAIAAAATLLALRDNDAPLASDAGSVEVFDAGSGKLVSEVAAGRVPQVVSADRGAGWVIDADGQTVSRVADGGTAPFATGATPTDLAAGAGAVWVVQGRPVAGLQTVGAVGTELVKLDPSSRTVRARVRLPRAGGEPARPAGDHVAVGRSDVWAVGPDGVVARVAASSGAVVARVRGFRARSVAVDGARVWVLAEDGEVGLVDVASGTVRARMKLAASAVSSLAAGNGAAFVSAPGDGVVWRVADSGGGLRARPIPVAAGVTDLAFGSGRLWAVSPLRGLVARVHPERATVELRVPVRGVPRGVAVEGGRVWVARSGETGQPAAELAGGLPRDRCGPVITARGGKPDALVAVDLPLQGGVRLSTQQIAQAVELVARDRRFKAGSHRFGVQVCDDSVARTGLSDPARCAANGRTYVRQEDVVAVIGPLDSGCAVELLPEAARGPVAVVSPLAQYVGLTRPAPGAPPGELERLYPGGRRHFARVYPADDAALRVVASAVRGRLVIVEDGRRDYGALIANNLAELAGAKVAGRVRWDPQHPRSAALAARVARLRPDAVFMAGTLESGAALALRSVRARIPARVPVYSNEGLTPTPQLVRRAGRAARGVRLVVVGLLPETLGGDARRLARRVEASLPGTITEPPALYAAAAAQVVFDALGRSDGSRTGVVREIFATRIARSPIGPIAFTPEGDIRAPAVTVLRVTPGARGGTFEQTEVERVLRAAP
jgi:DNA-binding SARP family transcriptional activator/ABC-type branched-subunit amino acid transport system substrate-binding protein